MANLKKITVLYDAVKLRDATATGSQIWYRDALTTRCTAIFPYRIWSLCQCNASWQMDWSCNTLNMALAFCSSGTFRFEKDVVCELLMPAVLCELQQLNTKDARRWLC